MHSTKERKNYPRGHKACSYSLSLAFTHTRLTLLMFTFPPHKKRRREILLADVCGIEIREHLQILRSGEEKEKERKKRWLVPSSYEKNISGLGKRRGEENSLLFVGRFYFGKRTSCHISSPLGSRKICSAFLFFLRTLRSKSLKCKTWAGSSWLCRFRVTACRLHA